MSPAPRRRGTSLDPGRRPDIEQTLTEKYGVDWSYLSGVNTNQFDIEQSQKNQARFEAINEQTVEEYTEAVNRGDKFPAVVAFRPRKNGRLVIIDGNHRLAAHDRAGAPIDVYEVDPATRRATVQVMTYGLNTKHGRATSEAERTTQAIWLIDNGASQEAAAAEMNVPLRLVKRALSRANADKRADEVGLDRREWDYLNQAVKARLLNITTDEGFREAARLAFRARLTSDEVFELVTNVNASRSATKQQQVVKAATTAYGERIQEVAGGVLGTAEKRTVGPRQRVGMVLGQVFGLPDDISAIARLYSGEDERGQVARQLADAAERLRKLAQELDSSVR